MKKKKSVVCWGALGVTLLIMALIFFLSAQPGQTSYGLSVRVTDALQHHATTTIATPSWFSANFHANVRKWAHVYIYCALGVSVSETVYLFLKDCEKVKQKMMVKGMLFSAAICTAYAITDEFHQWFVPGRAALLTDVGVDALGFLPCVAGTYLIIAWLRYRKRRRSFPESGNNRHLPSC